MKTDQKIDDFLQARIAEGDFPSAVYLVAEKGEIVLVNAFGKAVVEPEEIAATVDTIYDLASLTKVLATGLLCAKLIENRKISLDDQICKFFPEFDSNEKRDITVSHLLTHTSGFTAWLPFYLLVGSGIDVPAFIAKTPLENPIGTKVVYSDLNFILLGCLIEKLFGKPINQVFAEMVAVTLGLKNTFYNPPRSVQKRIAASEKGNAFEQNTCSERGFLTSSVSADGTDRVFRSHQIWGEVHDGNCFFMNGVSGHAGLFSTAFETFKTAQQFLAEETSLLKPETCELFKTNFTEGLNEARSIAFQLAATPESTAGAKLPPNAFGHLGFSGTSLWLDPGKRRIFILLTNRTHNRKLPFVNINSTRRRFNELAAEFLGQN